MPAPHIVVIGGGFAGLYATQALKNAGVRITLLDRRNHHTFQPLLYQVATAALNPSDIAVPIRRILRHQKNASVLLGEVSAVDRKRKRVHFSGRKLSYDKLIVATGATHFYFGNDAWAAHAPGLKTIEDALEIRRRVLFAFEAAEREDDEARRKAWLTFVVIGAGPTGVELAGALSEIARFTLAKDFRRIDASEANVILLEGGPRVLPAYQEDTSAKAQRQLERIGAVVRTDARATSIDQHGVTLEGGDYIPARTVLWAAGVAASALARSLDAPLDRAGRVLVTPELTLPGDDDVFVIGDLAAVQQDGKWVPGVAPAAMQQGKHTAENLQRATRNEPLEAFRYWDKGSLATIGKGAAVAEIGKLKLSGFIAWAAWLFIHVLFLIGFRNRLFVLAEWAAAYLAHVRGARLITGDDPTDALDLAGENPKLVTLRAEAAARVASARVEDEFASAPMSDGRRGAMPARAKPQPVPPLLKKRPKGKKARPSGGRDTPRA